MLKYDKLNRRTILPMLFAMVFAPALSQQLPVYTMQELVRPGVNPAYAGIAGISDVVLLTRQQWVGFEGAPTSYFLTTNVPLRSQKAGVGVDFQRNTSGPFTQNGLFIAYSYTIGISENSALSFGLRGGVNGYQIILSDLTVIDPGDPLFESSLNNKILPNFGTGLHYSIGKYFIDFSVPTLLRNEFSPDRDMKQGLQNREDRTYNFQTGAVYELSEGIKIHPTVGLWMLKDAPLLIDLRLSAEFQDAFGFGLVYRISGSFGAFLSVRAFENVIIGYAYEMPINYNYQLTSGTHEVVLGFDFEFLKRKTQSPRRF